VRDGDVNEDLSLLGHYAEHKISSRDDCFSTCDTEGSKCAAACLTLPDQCQLFKFGFEQIGESSGSTAYIKSEVRKELAETMDSMNEKFPLVRGNKKLIGHYQSSDTLTPSQCFNKCKQSPDCAGASFTIDTNWPSNCYFSAAGKFTESSSQTTGKLNTQLWTSYTKQEEEPITSSRRPVTISVTTPSTTFTEITTTTKRSGFYLLPFILSNTRLIGQSIPSKSTTASQCFTECDSNPQCAAASFPESPSPKCQLFKFGFEQRFRTQGWSSFVKPEVSDDIENMDKLTVKFPIVKLNTRLVNSYDNIDTLTPSMCFDTCRRSFQCAAASFTTDIRWSNNCFLFKKGFFESSEDLEFWISYAKVVPFNAAQPQSGGSGGAITVNYIQGNTIGSHNSDVVNANSGNTNVSGENVPGR
jgi:hypothetical protein